MKKKSEFITFRGKVFEKIYTKLSFACPNCCFFDASDQTCSAPCGKFDGCNWGRFYWVKVESKIKAVRMTNFEYMKSLSLEEFALRLGTLMASTHNDEDFDKWAIFRDQCQKWAKEYLQKEHKETKR